MTTYVGIDPGLTGAIAFVRDERVTAIEDMPTLVLSGGELVDKRVDGGRLFDALQRHCSGDDDVRIFLEVVRVLPQREDLKNNSVQTQGSLVRTLGAIEAVCDVFGVPPRLVTPQAWQKFFGLVSKERELRERGTLPLALLEARKLYPGAEQMLGRVRDHNRGEAVLIAHYGSRLPGG